MICTRCSADSVNLISIEGQLISRDEYGRILNKIIAKCNNCGFEGELAQVCKNVATHMKEQIIKGIY